MRKIKLIAIIFIISMVSSCSNSTGPKKIEKTEKSSNFHITAGSIDSSQVDSVVTDKPDALGIDKYPDEDASQQLKQTRNIQAKIVGITRKEAGLSTIEPMDFTNFSINKRLRELLVNAESYNNSDYKNGIVMGSGVLVSERFKDNIVNDIKIGTDIDYVKKTLGEPNVAADIKFIFYKTKEYYLVFKGYGKVEYAILVNRSISNDKDILRFIVNELDAENDLGGILEKNQKLSDFFEESGHINGGGWYANSYCGVEIEQFDSKTITIYNNFEADLFKVKDFEYDINFIDSDYQVKKAISSIEGYIADNYEFDTVGVLSPSGKLKSTYFWGYSMSYYFKIRTLDNSKPDFRVAVPAGDYNWLTDDYILYLNAWFTEPHIVKVSDDTSYDDIDIMYNLGVYDKDNSPNSSFSFSIKGIKDNIITLYDSESNKEYKVEYSIGNKGIEVKLAK